MTWCSLTRLATNKERAEVLGQDSKKTLRDFIMNSEKKCKFIIPSHTFLQEVGLKAAYVQGKSIRFSEPNVLSQTTELFVWLVFASLFVLHPSNI